MPWPLILLGAAGILLIGILAGCAMTVLHYHRTLPVVPDPGYPDPGPGENLDVPEIVEAMWGLGVTGADEAIQFLNQLAGAGLTTAQTSAVIAMANRADRPNGKAEASNW